MARKGGKVFFGEANHAIDNKGRLIFPAQFRQRMGSDFIMTKGLDKCIFVFPLHEWQVMEEKLKMLPMTDRDARAFVRYFFSGAAEGTFDKQGRVRIPQNLVDYASLEDRAYIIGVGTRLEIWSEDTWDQYNSDDQLSYDEIAQRLSDLGI